MNVMKFTTIITRTLPLWLVLVFATSCDNMLNEPLDNQALQENIDYTQTENMYAHLVGAYATFYNLQWETFPLISVRGDDVHAAGDQAPLTDTDEFKYNSSFWMYNSVWQNLYGDMFTFHGAMEEIDKYKEFAPNPAVAEQYKAEIRVMRAFELMQIARLWGSILIPTSSQSEELYLTPLSTFEEVMQHISDEMDEVAPLLPNVRPNQRTDLRGGVTRYTALAVKALANLEMENYQGVVDATDEIIGSGLFSLEDDYYNLFKKPGKLNNERLLELQYSDFGQGSGENRSYLYAFFGPNAWTPSVSGAGAGWGFWEPTEKYIKFMLDRGENVRLTTNVLFTQNGIDIIESDPNYNPVPAYITNETADGDVIGRTDGQAESRAKFSSGKHYLPSTQLTPGRTDYGTGNNFVCIRYAQILLIHAEAVVMGATSAEMTAAEAVNEVRDRADLAPLGAVTLDDVLDEKYAELAMEWGTRFEDLVRHNRTTELNDARRTYQESRRFLPYPQAQVDILSQLRDAQTNN